MPLAENPPLDGRSHTTDPEPIPSDVKPGRSKVRRWDVGSRGREAMAIPSRSRIRVTKPEERTSNPKRGCSNPLADTGQRAKSGRSIGTRFPAGRAARNPAIFDVEKSRGGMSEAREGIRKSL